MKSFEGRCETRIDHENRALNVEKKDRYQVKCYGCEGIGHYAKARRLSLCTRGANATYEGNMVRNEDDQGYKQDKGLCLR
jgi:hypothetical protein